MLIKAYKSFDGREVTVTLSEIDEDGKVLKRIAQKTGGTGWLLVEEALAEAGLPTKLFAQCDWRGFRVEHWAAV